MAEKVIDETERRKQVKLRIRGDLSITPQKYEGRTYYVVKDPVSLRYYRFKEQEHFLIQLMDGGHTLDESQKAFEKRFRPERLTLEDLEHFGQQLLNAGLAQNESPQAGKQLFDRRKKRRRTEILQAFTNILYIKVPIFDPERLLTKMLPYFRWMFTTWFFVLSVTFMLSAVWLVLTHFQTFRDRLPSYHEFFSFKTIIYMWAALGVVKVIHEFGHGLSCKAFGGEVHEMGFLILVFSPAMYCNVSDAWTLPNKWHRIIISFAGIYVELMIAAAATFIWWNTPHYPFVNYMALSLMVVCSVSTVFFNGNPLMRFDGYYVLADWIEIPNLRDRANRYLQRVVMDKCLGIEVQPEPYMELWRRILFVTYACISWVYRWWITFKILTFMAMFLKPYKLEIISNFLAALALGSMIGWPLFRLGKALHKRGRLPDMKSVRVAVTASILAALLFVFFFVPLPVSRVREMGLVQIQPRDDIDAHRPVLVHVHIDVPGKLEKIFVQEGQWVTKGSILAEFSNLELKNQEDDARTRLEIKRQEAESLQNQIVNFRKADTKELDKLRGDKLAAERERSQAEDHLKLIKQMLQKPLLSGTPERMQLRAPCDGHAINVPQIDEVGKRWEKDSGQPFCSIGDPNKLRVLVPISPDNYDLVRDNYRKAKARGEDLEVTIRVQGRDSRTWNGRISYMPDDAAKEVPPGLSNRGGGPVAIKPSNNPNQLVPQSQIYLVGIDIQDPDGAICPGVLAQVKIHCEHRSAAWWVWRLLSSTFDLGLL